MRRRYDEAMQRGESRVSVADLQRSWVAERERARCRCGGERTSTRLEPPPAVPAPELEGATELAGIRLAGEVARGGMGLVLRGFDPRLQRMVAVKVLLPETAARQLDVARFMREALLASQLDHPGIITIHRAGVARLPSGRPAHYLVMPLIAGQTLRQRIDDSPLPADVAALRARVRWMAEVAEALAQAHAEGILHRDIKPANILLDRDRAIVTDFGLAYRQSDGTRLTISGTGFGTLQYMPPEQMLGALDRLGPPADVWSMAAVLYELLAGRLPFDQTQFQALVKAIMAGDPPPPSASNPEVPPALDRICQQALQAPEGARPRDAAAFAADLRRWLAGEPTRAQAPGRGRLAWRALRRKPALQALLLLIVATLGIGLAALGWSRWQGQRWRLLAQRAAAEGRWADALVASEQARALASGDDLQPLVAQAKRQLRAERAAQAATRLAQLEIRRLQPLQRDLERALVRLYIPIGDGAPARRALAEVRARLEREAASPELQASGQAAWLVGRARWLSGDASGAVAALERARLAGVVDASLQLARCHLLQAWLLRAIAPPAVGGPLGAARAAARRSERPQRSPALATWAAYRRMLIGAAPEPAPVERQLGSEERWLAAGWQDPAAIERWLETSPRTPWRALVQIVVAGERGDWATADAQLGSLTAGWSSAALTAHVASARGQHARALLAIDRAARLRSHDADGLLARLRAQITARAGQPAEAIARLRQLAARPEAGWLVHVAIVELTPRGDARDAALQAAIESAPPLCRDAVEALR